MITEKMINEVRHAINYQIEDEGLSYSASTYFSHIVAELERKTKALEAIVDRSVNGELGTSKVLDMKKLAQEALK